MRVMLEIAIETTAHDIGARSQADAKRELAKLLRGVADRMEWMNSDSGVVALEDDVSGERLGSLRLLIGKG